MTLVPSRENLIIDHGQRRRWITESLLKEIVQGALKPGTRLVTQTLAKRYGVSHTPVREALISLAGVGIVDLQPNRGAIVKPVTPRDVREVCQVRRVLECQTVRCACGRIDPSILDSLHHDLERILSRKPPLDPAIIEEARALDSRLHDRIALASGNAFLAHELGRLTLLFRAFRDAAWAREEARNDYRRIGAEAREHLAVVEALREGDRPRAVKAMASHIRSGIASWSQALPENLKTPSTQPNGQPKPDRPASESKRKTKPPTTNGKREVTS